MKIGTLSSIMYTIYTSDPIHIFLSIKYVTQRYAPVLKRLPAISDHDQTFFCNRFTARFILTSSLYTVLRVRNITACTAANTRLTANPHKNKIHPSSDSFKYSLTCGNKHGRTINPQNKICHNGDIPIFSDCADTVASTAESAVIILLPLLPIQPFFIFRSYSFLCVLYNRRIAPMHTSTSHILHTIIKTEIYQKQNPHTAIPASKFKV